MSWLQAIIIAIVEGLTEFLPISSTGHMIITESLLGVESTEFVKAFTVIIQFGAILSVLVLYFKRFFQTWDFYWKLLIAFLPAAVLGFLFSDQIDELLEKVSVVAIMLILGGIFMLFADKLFAKTDENQKIGWKKALTIGFCQCIAMIPGVSRSMATIVGGMSQKLTRKNAAEFSFFLAVPTMAAASGWKVLCFIFEKESIKHLDFIVNQNGVNLLSDNVSTLIIGCVVAFIVAILAIKFFIDFLTKYGFKAFGYYRIIVGAAILILMFCNVNLRVG
ncbi:MAG: undecaprenyl-diphosphate phosphatase [Prevotellaceae bacterium]|jgi:undecaprenyl-diphosphatase|nr:undecaprenyl-diphosphate phosphatase [Prevotellaceae bacterium]